MITNPIPAAEVPCFRGRFAVVSLWDETARVSKRAFVTKSGIGEFSLAPTSTHEVLIRSQAVVARVVAGETLIVPIRSKVGDLASIYSFNGTGSLIWKLLESPRTLAQLAAEVAEAYEVDHTRVEQDVTRFVSEMKSVGLVEVPASIAIAGD